MFPYIIKTTFCLVLFLAFYHFVLEKEKMHRFNRFYLIGAIVFSFIVPSFIITVAPGEFIAPILDNSEFVSQMLPIETSTIQVAQEIDYTNYFIGLYIFISTILLLILTKKITQILVQTRRNKKVSYFSATVVLLKEQIVPYSFLQYIFLNKFTYQTDTIEQQILTHELAHVQQKHSLDILFIEFLQNLFWFNPIFRFYKKAIQLNHEFLADDAVIQSHKNISEYQYLLLNTTAQQNNIYLASNFNYSLTKKRLLMMTKPSSKTKILLKKLLVLPLIAGFIFAFAQRVEAQEKIPQVVEVIENTEEDVSEKEMNEYRALISKSKNARIFRYKQLNRMKELYKKMSIKQQNSVVDVYKLAPPLPRRTYKKKTPTKTQFNSWKNKEKFALWIDDKVVDNSVLSKYKNTDFPYFSGSYVYKNARKGKFPQEYQFHLYTHASFKKMKEREAQEKKNTITIFINKKGGLLVNGKVTTIHKLKSLLDKIDIDKNNAFVTINGDKNTKADDVIEVKKILRENKFYKLSINGKLLPPPPPMDIVYTYKRLAKRIQSSSKNRKANVIYLKELHGKMNASQKKQVTKPSRVLPPPPPKPKIREIKEIEETPELTEIEEVQELVEVRELKEIEEMPEIVEVIEVEEIPEVVEIQENPKVERIPHPKSIVGQIIDLIKKGATTFTYNKKKISSKKVIELIMANENLPMYAVSKKGIPTEIHFSDTPYVRESKKQELRETEKLRKAHEKEMLSIKGKPVVTGGRMKMSLLETAKTWKKKGARFLYNKKAITAENAIKIVSEKKDIRMYSAEKKGRTTLVYISDKK